MLAVATVFVGGFDFGTSKEDLEAHMSQAGAVVSVEMKKGNAVVTYSSSEEANSAVSTLNKSTIEGNSRFIDVKIDKKSLPPKPGMKRGRGEGDSDGSPKVLVRGFDFDTTDEQIEAHMGKVGTIEGVYWVNKGSANVIYSSASEATAAIKELNKTTIDGNSRFIDVVPGGDRSAKKFKGGGWEEVWPIASLPWMKKMMMPKGKGGGKGKKGGDHTDEDPAGSGRVFVRGFDFGTDDQQLESHMKKAGPIHTIHWVNKGNAVVVYKKKASAVKAVSTLDNTTISGNSRYINVSPRN